MKQMDVESLCPVVLDLLDKLEVEKGRSVRTEEIISAGSHLPEAFLLSQQVYNCLYLMGIYYRQVRIKKPLVRQDPVGYWSVTPEGSLYLDDLTEKAKSKKAETDSRDPLANGVVKQNPSSRVSGLEEPVLQTSEDSPSQSEQAEPGKTEPPPSSAREKEVEEHNAEHQSDPVVLEGTPLEQCLTYIRHRRRGVSRAEVLEKIKLKSYDWEQIRRKLLKYGCIEQVGTRRAATYNYIKNLPSFPEVTPRSRRPGQKGAQEPLRGSEQQGEGLSLLLERTAVESYLRTRIVDTELRQDRVREVLRQAEDSITRIQEETLETISSIRQRAIKAIEELLSPQAPPMGVLTKAWLDDNYEELHAYLMKHLPRKLPRSAVVGQIEDHIDKFCMNLIKRGSLDKYINEGRKVQFSVLLRWCYEHAVTDFRREGKDAGARSARGSRTEKEMKERKAKTRENKPEQQTISVSPYADIPCNMQERPDGFQIVDIGEVERISEDVEGEDLRRKLLARGEKILRRNLSVSYADQYVGVFQMLVHGHDTETIAGILDVPPTRARSLCAKVRRLMKESKDLGQFGDLLN